MSAWIYILWHLAFDKQMTERCSQSYLFICHTHTKRGCDIKRVIWQQSNCTINYI